MKRKQKTLKQLEKEIGEVEFMRLRGSAVLLFLPDYKKGDNWDKEVEKVLRFKCTAELKKRARMQKLKDKGVIP